MSTIKQIAQLAGVSRGTVDRVLNNRGEVNPDTAEKVHQIAKAVQYSPNRLGKRLAVKKKSLKFGFVLFSTVSSNPFFEQVVHGINSRANSLKEYGASVDVRYAAIDKPELQVQLIDELVDLGVDGIALTPINHPLVRKRLLRLKEQGIPFVNANSDIPDSGRIAYVGSDYYRCGQTAGGLMRLITGGHANVGIVIGSPLVLCHSERVSGFMAHVQSNSPGIQILDTVQNHDDDLESFSVTTQLLKNQPGINALFLAGGGTYGACRAVVDAGKTGEIKIVSYDAIPNNKKMLAEGVISATIAQQPQIQGSKPLELLLDYVGLDIPPVKDSYFTEIEIIIKENL